MPKNGALTYLPAEPLKSISKYVSDLFFSIATISGMYKRAPFNKSNCPCRSKYKSPCTVLCGASTLAGTRAFRLLLDFFPLFVVAAFRNAHWQRNFRA